MTDIERRLNEVETMLEKLIVGGCYVPVKHPYCFFCFKDCSRDISLAWVEQHEPDCPYVKARDYLDYLGKEIRP